MNDKLNPNEKAIMDIFLKNRYLISRPVLENSLVKKGVMASTTLTDRLNYLIEIGLIERKKGKKGAVFYALADDMNEFRNKKSFDLTIKNVNNASQKEQLWITYPIQCSVEYKPQKEFLKILEKARKDAEKTIRLPPRKKREYLNRIDFAIKNQKRIVENEPESCPDCKSYNLHRDYQKGELICQECGLVIRKNICDLRRGTDVA